MSKAVKKAKTVAATIKLVIKAGQAKPGPPVGPALGQAGLQIMTFCKDFNAKTADMKVTAAILLTQLTLLLLCSERRPCLARPDYFWCAG